ncbi:unnamed protein product [Protopolystoma xenopodis]|uniref:Band 3 cytoplasmic domain-containing protein n=1 Tax=Protopolystoma xenopodis TaxID=117903 RepID=A0A3S5CBM1_9PLAT|nr:unnamed protein product [Protopolystoma xenopodis]
MPACTLSHVNDLPLLFVELDELHYRDPSGLGGDFGSPVPGINRTVSSATATNFGGTCRRPSTGLLQHALSIGDSTVSIPTAAHLASAHTNHDSISPADQDPKQTDALAAAAAAAAQYDAGVYWQQVARWVKYEEDYTPVEKRFSEAHVSPLRFHTILEFQKQLKNLIILDSYVDSTYGVMEGIAKIVSESDILSPGVTEEAFTHLLLAERFHPGVKSPNRFTNILLREEEESKYIANYGSLL